MTERQQSSGLPWILLTVGLIVGSLAIGVPGTFLIGPVLFPRTVTLTTTATSTVSERLVIAVPTYHTLTVPGPPIVNTVTVTRTAAAPYYPSYPYYTYAPYPYQPYQTGTLHVVVAYSGSGSLWVDVRDISDSYAQPVRQRAWAYTVHRWTATFSGLTIGHYYQVTVYPLSYQTTILLNQAYQQLSLP